MAKLSIDEFKEWFKLQDLDFMEDFDIISNLYDAILSETAGAGEPDYHVSQEIDSLTISADNPEIAPVRIDKSTRGVIKAYLDSLYLDHGGVCGEETYRNNMARNN